MGALLGTVSTKGRAQQRAVVVHVLRRLSMGPQPDLASSITDPDAAIARALDLSALAATPPTIAPPADYDAAQTVGALEQPLTFWLQQMASSPRLIEERLVWFWHDHFATSVAKVRIPYLMWQQHLLLREHATGSFAAMLHAISKDPAMLWYLDGVTNSVRQRNENFGREVMELFTLGRGNYTEQDVVEASRAFTGWAVNIVGLRQSATLSALIPPWNAGFLATRHDNGTKTLLGTTANLDLDGALDVLLNHEATAPHVASKLYTELVGVAPSENQAKRLGKTFRDQGYAVMPLVEAIVAEKAFTSREAIEAKVRSPIEKLIGIVQAIPPTNLDVGRLGRRVLRGTPRGVANALRTLGYVPFVPPNVAGYPKGLRLAGPHQLVHAFDLLSVYPSAPVIPTKLGDLLERYALVDVSDRTRDVLTRETDPTRRLALLVASPEFGVV